VIEIKDLKISFDGVSILDGINLNIQQNEITTIIGQSGCGKSVLMKAIEGLIVPESGTILIDGIDLFSLNRKKLKKARRKIAMLFQGAALLDSLNAFQNIALPLKEHTSLSDEEIYRSVEDKLKLVGLVDVMEKMPSELSGGMKKRIALARATILKPDYIIYDEPTTGLDPIIAQEITDLILKLHKESKITSIIITHDLNCIHKVKSNIAMIHDKNIIFDGSYDNFMKANDKIIKEFVS
jgi:phospholipid/cholesterol/gamma-HCH transport system ATP-binding protein